MLPTEVLCFAILVIYGSLEHSLSLKVVTLERRMAFKIIYYIFENCIVKDTPVFTLYGPHTFNYRILKAL